MISDFLTFLKNLPFPSPGSGSILPDSFREQIPLDSIFSFFSDMNNSVKIAGAGVTLILALIACFLGYKLAKLFMSITGFLAGCIIGLTVGYKVLKLGTPLTALCTLAGGILLSLLAYRIYVAGIFILCFILAFIAAAALLPLNGDIQFFLSTLIGFIIGSLAVKFIRPVIIFSSALTGGWIASGLIVTLCEQMNIYTFTHFTSGGLTLILCLLGILVQFFTTSDEDEVKRRKKKEQKKRERRERKEQKRLQKQN